MSFNTRIKISSIILFVSVLTIVGFYPVNAVYPFNIAESIKMDKKPPIGAIISRDGNGYRLSKQRYDTDIVGVVVESSDIVFEYVNPQKGVYEGRYLVDFGKADILVNESNGPIKKGDYLTSSDIPGEGMKADTDGIFVGVALENFKPSASDGTGLVHAAVQVKFSIQGDEFTAQELFSKYGLFGSLISFAIKSVQLGPDRLAKSPPFFRYILGGLLILVGLVLGFYMFGRIAMRGIESLGRNPRARWTILAGIAINIIFTLLLIGFAILLAYVIFTI